MTGSVAMQGQFTGTLINRTNKELDTHENTFILSDLTDDTITGMLYVKEGAVSNLVYVDRLAEYL